MLRQVTIIGLGLIGGSLGLALRNKSDLKVVGQDIDPFSRETAVAREAVHWSTNSLKLAVEDADLVILAVPVRRIKGIIQNMSRYLKTGCVITDVGSTKGELVKEISHIIPPAVYYIGAHPMAGSERGGIGGANPYLFENAIFCVTPNKSTHPKALKTVSDLAKLIGAKVFSVSPEKHDKMVAGVSHLPYIVAVNLVNTVSKLVEEDLPDTLTLAAGGFRDTTRVAGGDPVMWRDISLTNREYLVQIIDRFQKELAGIRQTIRETDEGKILECFTRAKETREKIPFRFKGLLPQVYELVVTVPDRPGMLSLITGSLGTHNINISEIEVLRVRENHEGTIRLAFEHGDSRDRAAKVLKNQGLTVQRR